MSLALSLRDAAPRIVGAFERQAVLIVGDIMLDHFLIGRVNRISPEAPVPVVEFNHDEYRLGGAANVAHNVRALGGSVVMAGVVGPDEAGHRLLRELEALGIGTDGVVTDQARPTTRKLRVVTNRNQQVARVDYESDAEVSGEIEHALAERVERTAQSAGVIVVSDYLKGAITRQLMARLIACGRSRGVPVLVDPKIPHIDYYGGATLVTPNHVEAEIATHMRVRTSEDARTAARAFRRLARCESVLITRGEYGMWLLEGGPSDDGIPRNEEELHAVAREVSDVTGAGDTVIATLALSLAAGARMADAAQLANYAAGVVVGKFGPGTVSPPELLEALR